MEKLVTETAGTVADCTQASMLIEGFGAQYLLADRGCDADAIVAKAVAQRMTAVISPKKNRLQPRFTTKTFIVCTIW